MVGVLRSVGGRLGDAGAMLPVCYSERELSLRPFRARAAIPAPPRPYDRLAIAGIQRRTVTESVMVLGYAGSSGLRKVVVLKFVADTAKDLNVLILPFPLMR